MAQIFEDAKRKLERSEFLKEMFRKEEDRNKIQQLFTKQIIPPKREKERT